jgi:hypothetical protein
MVHCAILREPSCFCWEKKYRERGIAVWLVALSPEVFAVVDKAPLGMTLGHERMFLNLEQALAACSAFR